MSGPKLQDAQLGDSPGKIVELVLKLSHNDDDMPTVEVRREGESEPSGREAQQT